MAELQRKLDEALEHIKNKQHAAAQPLLLEVFNSTAQSSDAVLAAKETALQHLIQVYRATKYVQLLSIKSMQSN